MKHNGNQWDGVPKEGAVWNNMTDEDLVEFEKHMEEEAKKPSSDKKSFIPKDNNPPF